MGVGSIINSWTYYFGLLSWSTNGFGSTRGYSCWSSNWFGFFNMVFRIDLAAKFFVFFGLFSTIRFSLSSSSGICTYFSPSIINWYFSLYGTFLGVIKDISLGRLWGQYKLLEVNIVFIFMLAHNSIYFI